MAPFIQRRKVWLTPNTRVPCSNAAKTRKPLKFAGVMPVQSTGFAAARRCLRFLVLSCGFFFYLLFSSPNLSRRRLDVCHTSDTWCGLSANLECMSEMCCTRLAENRAIFGTIGQLCRAVSSQLRHISTIGKKLVKQQYLLHMSLQYGELPPSSG